MAIAGKVMPRPRGEYDPSVLYDVLDMVTYDNKLWMSKMSNNIGIVPATYSEVEWMLLIDGGLAVVDGVLTIEADKGSYEIKDSSGKNAFLKKNTETETVEVGISDDPDNVQQVAVNSASTDINDAVKLERRVNGEFDDYRMYGEHNKPTGSYTGDGATATRNIDIGGIGTMILVSSDTGMVLVSNRGGIGMTRTDGNVVGIPSYRVRFDGGQLYITNEETNDLLNKADQQYWYQVL